MIENLPTLESAAPTISCRVPEARSHESTPWTQDLIQYALAPTETVTHGHEADIERKKDMNTRDLIRLFIVSDNHIVRSGLRRILESCSRIVVIGDTSARDARTTEVYLKHHPELVLIDLDGNGTDALALVSKLKKDLKHTLVLVMGDLGDDRRTLKALKRGAAGVVLKSQPPSVLIAAIESLFTHPSEQVEFRKVEPERVSFRIPSRSHALPNMQKFGSLTERECGVVALIASGITNKDIAEQLHISDITVRHHLTNIYMKVGVPNRQKLLLLAYEQGLAVSTTDSAS